MLIQNKIIMRFFILILCVVIVTSCCSVSTVGIWNSTLDTVIIRVKPTKHFVGFDDLGRLELIDGSTDDIHYFKIESKSFVTISDVMNDRIEEELPFTDISVFCGGDSTNIKGKQAVLNLFRKRTGKLEPPFIISVSKDCSLGKTEYLD